jgi:hypothetical protein
LLGTLGTIVKWAVFLPLFLAIVLLAIANGQSVTVHLNPFDPEDPVLRVDLALYQLGFAIFAIGAVVGALVAWQSRRRAERRAQARREAAARWHERAPSPQSRPSMSTPPAVGTLLPRPERG